jgi:hypothetical protein
MYWDRKTPKTEQDNREPLHHREAEADSVYTVRWYEEDNKEGNTE